MVTLAEAYAAEGLTLPRAAPDQKEHRLQGYRSISERFWNFVIPEPNSGCWLWMGACDRRGYGQMRARPKLLIATHVSLQLAGRPLPAGLMACHICDNPPCVNPDHLFAGTMKDNIRDAIQKGRAKKPPRKAVGCGLKAECWRGHPMAAVNLIFRSDGSRACRECSRIAKGELVARRAAVGLTARGTPRKELGC